MAEQYITIDKMLVVESSFKFEEESKKLRDDGFYPMFTHCVNTSESDLKGREIIISQHWTKTIQLKKSKA